MFSNIPPVVKNLLIINALLLLGTYSLQHAGIINLEDYLALHYFQGSKFNPLQFATYMFMHANFTHLVFNMFSLWMFGRILEQVWGSQKFATYYFLTGIGAGLLHTAVTYFELMPMIAPVQAFLQTPTPQALGHLLDTYTYFDEATMNNLRAVYTQWMANPASSQIRADLADEFLKYIEAVQNAPTVLGASGSVYGILLAYGFIFPNARIMLLIPPVPLKAKYFVIIFGLFEFVSGMQNNPTDNVAHFAHLGGMVFGFILLKAWKQRQLL